MFYEPVFYATAAYACSSSMSSGLVRSDEEQSVCGMSKTLES